MIRNKVILALFGASFLFLILSMVVGFVGFPQEPGGLLIFHFDVSANRADILGDIGMFFGILGIAVSIVIVNLLLAWRIYLKERFISYILAGTTVFLSVLFFIVSILIAKIN